MSVAALPLKRGLDWDTSRESGTFPPCRLDNKKCRVTTSPSLAHNNRLSNAPSNNGAAINQESHFNKQIPVVGIDKFFAGHNRKGKLRHRDEIENNPDLDTSNAQNRRSGSPPKHGNDMLFTLDQVKNIVSKALEEREQQLRFQYEKILQEKLLDQFNEFSRFNQDNIHKRMSESTYSYMC
eukprot:CFRG1311T1